MSPAAPPVAPRAEVSFSFLETVPEAPRVCRVWLWSEAGNDTDGARALLRACETLSPEERTWKVERVPDLACVPTCPPPSTLISGPGWGEKVPSNGAGMEELCLLWGASEAQCFRALATFRARNAVPVVVVLRLADGEARGAAKRRILEAGASDCILDEELSAPLLEHCLRGALREARAQDNARALEARATTSKKRSA